ncbi:hypothetical protein ACFFGH_28955 [Lysobacter korlensis]|uniref:Alpha/beta hydrolase n=1 Tax=Lysobacter korlensis TaxID=553636 RepID=A0ABV6RZI8_9GAMM
MASRSGSSWRLSAALWAEHRLPGLARMLQPSAVLPGELGPHGIVYRGADGGPLLVLVGGAAFEPLWLGSALASALGGVAVVVPEQDAGSLPAGALEETADEPEVRGAQIRAAIASAPTLRADAERVAIVGVGDGCSAALLTVAAPATASAVRRLVLLTPTSAPKAEFGRVPPTFLQSAPQSATLAASRSLEIDLRDAGVAVRPVEYTGLPDAWVRYPRFAPGSKRAVGDIVAFLRRGFGMTGTFSVEIPGWDLK